ncbi:nitrogen fixation protein FixH [Rhodoligotrophos appendicifer]|uniref:FixH family protein n=1 Tax=Rhodoligotrophos appendicifer TaxID=987056 RepID=UPI0011855CA5|nr:FixH family protein [Rhodoligotrophos appendicifer]
MRILRLDDEHPLTGWHALAIVVLFFGTIITVNLIMASFATGTFPGLVVQNSYVASQHYNALLAAGRAQDKRGLVARMEAEGGYLRFRLTGADGKPLSGLEISVHVGRPSTAREDRTLTLRPDGDSYRSEASLPPGLWEVDLQAERNGDLVFRRTEDVMIAAGGAADGR